MPAADRDPLVPSFHLDRDGYSRDKKLLSGDYVFFFDTDDAGELRWRQVSRSRKGEESYLLSLGPWISPFELSTGRELSVDEIRWLLSAAPVTATIPPYGLEQLGHEAVRTLEFAAGFAIQNRARAIHMEHLLGGLAVVGALAKPTGNRMKEVLDGLERGGKVQLKAVSPRPLTVVPRLSKHVLAAFLAAGKIAKASSRALLEPDMLFDGARTIQECSSIRVLEDVIKNGAGAVSTTTSTSTSTTTSTTTSTSTSSTTASHGPAFSGVRLTPYLSDHASGEDGLELRPYVRALAALLVNRDVVPPLSVGLFGDWGSGKSFFISQLKATIKDFTHQAKSNNDLPFWAGCAQIEFNAWQYADAELWGSLVVRVLEELARELSPKAEEPDDEIRTKLVAGLQSVATRKQQLDKEFKLARNAVEEAKAQAQDISLELRRSEAWLNAAQSLGAINRQQRDELAAEITASKGYVGLALRRTMRQPLAFVALVALIAAVWAGWASDFPSWLAGLTGLGGLIAAAVKAALVYAAVKSAGSTGLPHNPNDTDREWIAKLEKDEAQKLAALQEAETKEQDLKARAAASLDPRASLLELLGRSPEYEKSLGLVSQIHRDFSQLGKLIEKVRFKSPETGEPRIERIILYIDDLDRCTPKRVVEVLQAVHLLLAFDLFVVVVAVDPRWLKRALEVHYPDLLLTANDTAPNGKATSRDYLEKIFQIPFSLPSLSAARVNDFETLRHGV